MTSHEALRLTPEYPSSPERTIPSLKLILNGQGEGAAMLFDALRKNGHDIVGVVTIIKEGNPDPLQVKAEDSNIPILNLSQINKPEGQEKMKKWKADLGVGFYLQSILSNKTIKIPAFGTMNTHYSLLPKNRGRDAMNRSVLAGEDIGISTFMMNEVVDGGDIIDQASFPNPDDMSQGALYYKYLSDFVKFVAGSVDKMAIGIDEYKKNGTPLPVTSQDETKATSYSPLSEEELRVNFAAESALSINRKMNSGGPGATTILENEKYKIGKPTKLEGPPLQPGRIVERTDKEMLIEANQGLIKIGRMQKI